MYYDELEYTYLYRELGGELDEVKVGHGSAILFKRVDGQQTGNPRALIPIVSVIGNFDEEFKKHFSTNRFGTGGKEWYKLIPEMMDFFYTKMVAAINIPNPVLETKEFGNGPIQLDKVELTEPELRPAAPVRMGGTIQPYVLQEASPLKSRYARLEKVK